MGFMMYCLLKECMIDMRTFRFPRSWYTETLIVCFVLEGEISATQTSLHANPQTFEYAEKIAPSRKTKEPRTVRSEALASTLPGQCTYKDFDEIHFGWTTLPSNWTSEVSLSVSPGRNFASRP